METVYYITLYVDKLEQKLIRHDYKTCQTSDFQFHFHRTCILKNANIMETKLYNRILSYRIYKKIHSYSEAN
jgi:hypothetical protein